MSDRLIVAAWKQFRVCGASRDVLLSLCEQADECGRWAGPIRDIGALSATATSTAFTAVKSLRSSGWVYTERLWGNGGTLSYQLNLIKLLGEDAVNSSYSFCRRCSRLFVGRAKTYCSKECSERARVKSTWRLQAAPIIEDILRSMAGMPSTMQDLALENAYPFEKRSGYPAAMWWREIRHQRKMFTYERYVA